MDHELFSTSKYGFTIYSVVNKGDVEYIVKVQNNDIDVYTTAKNTCNNEWRTREKILSIKGVVIGTIGEKPSDKLSSNLLRKNIKVESLLINCYDFLVSVCENIVKHERYDNYSDIFALFDLNQNEEEIMSKLQLSSNYISDIMYEYVPVLEKQALNKGYEICKIGEWGSRKTVQIDHISRLNYIFY